MFCTTSLVQAYVVAILSWGELAVGCGHYHKWAHEASLAVDCLSWCRITRLWRHDSVNSLDYEYPHIRVSYQRSDTTYVRTLGFILELSNWKTFCTAMKGYYSPPCLPSFICSSVLTAELWCRNRLRPNFRKIIYCRMPQSSLQKQQLLAI